MRIAITGIGALALLLCTALVDPCNAKGGGGGGHGGGGHGGGHGGGGGHAAHFGGGHGGGGGRAAHFGGGGHRGGFHGGFAHPGRGMHAAHFGGARHGGIGRRGHAGHAFHGRFAGRGPSFARSARAPRSASRDVIARGSAAPARAAPRRSAFGALRPFVRAGFPRGHVGWAGALFWPYAYGDLFYYALWPYQYDDDRFWTYGYDDVYASVFRSYGDEALLAGRHARAHREILARRTARACADGAAEVIGWPIDRISEVVEPNDQQRTALNELADAIAGAGEVIRSACPKAVAFTATGRLDAMANRVERLIEAVNIVRPPLERFYAALSDEQKARFNVIGVPEAQASAGSRSGRQNVGHGAAPAQPNPQAACAADAASWPTDRIERTVRTTPEQRVRLDALTAAAAKAADTIRAACPSDIPATPVGRLDAVAKRLKAILQGVKEVRAALADFYGSLDDEQKARFNAMGRT